MENLPKLFRLTEDYKTFKKGSIYGATHEDGMNRYILGKNNELIAIPIYLTELLHKDQDKKLIKG